MTPKPTEFDKKLAAYIAARPYAAEPETLARIELDKHFDKRLAEIEKTLRKEERT